MQIHTHLVAFLTRLGRNYDYTTCTGCTIDTRRTGILQYGNGLNIVGVERSAHHTVNYIYRCTACGNTTCTTDTDLRCIAGLTTRVAYIQTGYLTLQHVTDIIGRDICQLVC